MAVRRRYSFLAFRIGALVVSAIAVPAYGLPGDASGAYRQISAGSEYSCALTEAAEAICWGANDAGKARARRGGFRQISAGGNHTLALADTRARGMRASAPSRSAKVIADAPAPLRAARSPLASVCLTDGR